MSLEYMYPQKTDSTLYIKKRIAELGLSIVSSGLEIEDAKKAIMRDEDVKSIWEQELAKRMSKGEN